MSKRSEKDEAWYLFVDALARGGIRAGRPYALATEGARRYAAACVAAATGPERDLLRRIVGPTGAGSEYPDGHHCILCGEDMQDHPGHEEGCPVPEALALLGERAK